MTMPFDKLCTVWPTLGNPRDLRPTYNSPIHNLEADVCIVWVSADGDGMRTQAAHSSVPPTTPASRHELLSPLTCFTTDFSFAESAWWE